jgi:predicted nuclease of restriction endonuclease-like RecB superfamily
MRSTYETRIAYILDKMSIEWEYEHAIFQIDDYSSYRPDFYLLELGIFIETKGFWRPHDKKKMIKLFNKHPDKKIRLVYSEHLDTLEKQVALGTHIDFTAIGISLEEQVILWFLQDFMG